MIALYTPDQFKAAKSRDQLALRCEQCSNPFTQFKHYIQVGRGRFCSRECRVDAQRRPKVTVHCHRCEKPIQKSIGRMEDHNKNGLDKHYCSRRCATITNNTAQARNPAKERICYRCDKPFKAERGHPSRKACPECHRHREYLGLLTIAEVEQIGELHEKKDRYGRIRSHCRLIHAKLADKPCAKCGYDKHVEICHIRAISDWPKDTLIKIVNAESNVIQLCRNHHWEQENGLLKVAHVEGVEPSTFSFAS